MFRYQAGSLEGHGAHTATLSQDLIFTNWDFVLLNLNWLMFRFTDEKTYLGMALDQRRNKRLQNFQVLTTVF